MKSENVAVASTSKGATLRTGLALSVLSLIWLAAMGQPAAAVTTYIEDFEHDILGNTSPGFATAVFQHAIVGTNAFLVDDSVSPAIPPSLHHQLFLGAATTDLVTFDLPPGQTVDYAGVWMTGTGGGFAAVTFIGANGVAEFTTVAQDLYQFFDTSTANIGEIIGVHLGIPFPPGPGPGPEGLYDNIIINVVPEPAAWILAVTAIIALAVRSRSTTRSRRATPQLGV